MFSHTVSCRSQSAAVAVSAPPGPSLKGAFLLGLVEKLCLSPGSCSVCLHPQTRRKSSATFEKDTHVSIITAVFRCFGGVRGVIQRSTWYILKTHWDKTSLEHRQLHYVNSFTHTHLPVFDFKAFMQPPAEKHRLWGNFLNVHTFEVYVDSRTFFAQEFCQTQKQKKSKETKQKQEKATRHVQRAIKHKVTLTGYGSGGGGCHTGGHRIQHPSWEAVT